MGPGDALAVASGLAIYRASSGEERKLLDAFLRSGVNAEEAVDLIDQAVESLRAAGTAPSPASDLTTAAPAPTLRTRELIIDTTLSSPSMTSSAAVAVTSATGANVAIATPPAMGSRVEREDVVNSHDDKVDAQPALDPLSIMRGKRTRESARVPRA
jgi:hypothetical protein